MRYTSVPGDARERASSSRPVGTLSCMVPEQDHHRVDPDDIRTPRRLLEEFQEFSKSRCERPATAGLAGSVPVTVWWQYLAAHSPPLIVPEGLYLAPFLTDCEEDVI